MSNTDSVCGDCSAIIPDDAAYCPECFEIRPNNPPDPATIHYLNGPFNGQTRTGLPNPPPETLTGDAYVGMRLDGEPMYERTTYHRRECADGVWLYEVWLT